MINNAYRRPKRLSDPFCDFTKEELVSIIEKADRDLNEYDFRSIFQSRLPAGEYEECAYFVPLLLNYVDSNDFSPDLIQDFLWWCFEYRDELRKDRFDVSIKSELARLFKAKTEAFILVVRKNKICPLPEYDTLVNGLISGMVDYGVDKWNARTFISLLYPCTSYEKACWLFYIFNHEYYIDVSTEFYLDVSNEDLAECSAWLLCGLLERKDDLLFPYMKHAVTWPKCDWKRKNVMSCLVALFESRDIDRFANDMYAEIPAFLMKKIKVVLECGEGNPADRLLVQDIVFGLLSLD